MKKRRMSYRNSKGSRDTQPISTIHMDTNGPMKTMGVYGSVGTIQYFLSIIDDNTSWRWSFVLRNKKEVFDKVKELLLQLERDGKFTIRRIRSDGGTEFVNAAFKISVRRKVLSSRHLIHTVLKKTELQSETIRVNLTEFVVH